MGMCCPPVRPPETAATAQSKLNTEAAQKPWGARAFDFTVAVRVVCETRVRAALHRAQPIAEGRRASIDCKVGSPLPFLPTQGPTVQA